ncbi:mannan endo-1,4-beta-mannosidase 4 [Cajanus cajan]|uniref:mannan endo-1,4-beta-mannosidase 4 n=1 Tax=Cajanus cajan TaxID=3821 RepID=UPI00098DABB8|nr:mannan endo-1,4-beta-mannosidase 4 [Cajanus cajan]
MGFQNFILLIFMITLVIGEYGNCRVIIRDSHHHHHHHSHKNSATKILYDSDNSSVQRSGNHFVLNGKPYYLNGFNAYWLMNMASDPSSSSKVTTAFQQAAQQGLNVARTWAFNDGGDKALQISPGSYNENVFKGLDFVISEAGKNGVQVILSLVNNWNDFGGKNKYVQWAKERGQNVNNDDDFFTHPVVKQYYKNHIKTVLTRKNTITGLIYKDDPAIFAWELMNEPRCQSDNSGKSFQDWVGEMGAYVKSIDNKHLLEIGLEGFYGESMPEKKQINPGGIEIGTDFISNNQVPEIDFATIHLYPDQWLSNSNETAQDIFGHKWVEAHIEDSNNVLKKPILLSEFGKSTKCAGYRYSVDKRNSYFEKQYKLIYNSGSRGGSCVGGLFWQLMVPGMDGYGDGYQVIFEESPSTAHVIAQQSKRMSSLK